MVLCAGIIDIASQANGIGHVTPASRTGLFKFTQQESLVGCIWKKHLDCFDVCSRHGEDMCRAFDERAGQWLAPEVANFGPFLHANVNRMRAGRLSSHGVHSGWSHFNVLAISQETAKKTFRNGTATNITGTNEEDAFHKMPPRDPAGRSGTFAQNFANATRLIWTGMRAAWKKLRYRFEYVGLLLAAKIVPLFPRTIVSGWQKYVASSPPGSIPAAGVLPWPISTAPSLANIPSQKRAASFANPISILPKPCWIWCGARGLLRKISSVTSSLRGFPRSIRTRAGLLFVITTAISNGWASEAGFAGVPAPLSLRNSRTPCWIQFSDGGGSSQGMSLVRARAEFFDFSKLCAVVAISRCSSISRFFRGPRRSRFDVLECTPVLLPLTPGSSNAREPLLFPLIASRCREDGIVWFFIRQLILVPTPARAKLRRRAGIPSSRSCARSPGRGCGCTNTGVIARRILIGPTRSILGTPESSKDWSRKNDLYTNKCRTMSPSCRRLKDPCILTSSQWETICLAWPDPRINTLF
jgi:hypothetical protein